MCLDIVIFFKVVNLNGRSVFKYGHFQLKETNNCSCLVKTVSIAEEKQGLNQIYEKDCYTGLTRVLHSDNNATESREDGKGAGQFKRRNQWLGLAG